MTEQVDELSVIFWNVYEGNPARRVRKELKDMINDHNPDLIVLVEARFLHGDLGGLGYRVVQRKNRRRKPKKRPNSRPATANVAILVRRNLKIKARGSLMMKHFWKGPKHGFLQDPRVHRWIRVEKKTIWKIGGFHNPFGAKARKESNRAIRRFIKNTKKRRPVLALGDYQMRRPALKKKIVDRPKVQAKSAGVRIDHAIFDNCRLVDMKNLGMRNSDHPALLFLFEKTLRN